VNSESVCRGTVSRVTALQLKENVMLTALATIGSVGLLAQAMPNLVWLAIVFFIIAIVAYVLGARGVAGMSAGIGRTLLFVFLVLAIIFVIIGLVNNASV
jgi:uncharacterized membrane protein YtjA (UPF0391 family)